MVIGSYPAGYNIVITRGPTKLSRKQLRRARAFLNWERDGGPTQDSPDGPTPATPAVRKKAIPASAEVEPKRPRRGAREACPKRPPRDDEDGDARPTKKKQPVCPTGTFVRDDVVATSGGGPSPGSSGSSGSSPSVSSDSDS